MEHNLAHTKNALWQISALLLLAALLSLGVNAIRTDGIPLIGNWSIEARYANASGDSLIIAPELAALLFEQDAAVFVDARPRHQFIEGSIPGALSLPWQEVDHYFNRVVQQLDDTKALIVYCDGETCDLSHELALFLKSLNYENVHVLVNGWSVWQQAGLPTATGE